MKTRQVVITTVAALALSFMPCAYAACKSCGTVVDVTTIKKEGEGSGLGAVVGGVAGGVLGHQVGGGRGKDVATVAGAVGGAYVGHQVEKSSKSTLIYRVQIKMEEGNIRTFNYSNPTSFQVGDKVRITDGKVVRQKS
jgi:uncharacterized protein YcfJ